MSDASDEFGDGRAAINPAACDAVATPHVRLRMGRPVSQHAGSEGCTGLAGA